MEYFNSTSNLMINTGNDIQVYFHTDKKNGDPLIFNPKRTFKLQNKEHDDIISLLLDMGDGKYIFIGEEMRSFEYHGEIKNFGGYFVEIADNVHFEDDDYIYLLSGNDIVKFLKPNKKCSDYYMYFRFNKRGIKWDSIPFTVLRSHAEDVHRWVEDYERSMYKVERLRKVIKVPV